MPVARNASSASPSSRARQGTRAELAAAVALLALGWPAAAHAYLDPLTGSVLFQAIVGTVLGALFAVKVYWRKIKGYFTGRTAEDPDSSSSSEGSPAEDER